MLTHKPVIHIRTGVVREIMARRNLSQNHLARKLEISKGYMSQLLNGARRPSAPVRERLMDVLRVDDFDELFLLERPAEELAA